MGARLDGHAEGVADLDGEGGQRAAHRAEPVPHVWVARGDRLAVVLGTEDGDGGAGLGQPVRVDQAHVGQLFEGPLDQGHRHAAPAIGQMAQRGQLLVALDEDLEDAPEHGRHHHGVGDGLRGGQVHPGLGRELGQVDQAPARPHRGQHGRDAGDVVRRDAHQGGVVGVGPHELDRLEHVAGEVAMAQHGGLGLPRRPAGEEQHGRVLGVAVAQGGGGTVGHQELGPRDQREAR